MPKDKNRNLGIAIDKHIKLLKADKDSIFYKLYDKTFDLKKVLVPVWIKWVLTVGTGLTCLLFSISIFLNIQVKKRTLELESEIVMRKGTEKALQRNKERLAEAQKIAKLGYFVFDIRKDSWTSSTELDDIFGIDKTLIKNAASWLQIIHPDHRETMSAYLQKNILKQHQTFGKEYKIISKRTGQEKWVHGLGELKFDKNKNPVEVFGTIQDVTERKQMEKKILDSEQNMSSVLNNTQDLVVRINRNFRHIFANPATYAANGFSPVKYLGKTNEEIGMPDELCAFWRKKHDKVFQSKEPEVFEFSFRTVNKGVRVFQAIVSPELDDNNEVKTIVSFMRDITESKQIFEALEKQKEFNEKIVQTSNAIIVGLDKNHKIKIFNKGAEKITGFKTKEVIDKDWFEIFFEPDIYDEMNNFWKTSWGTNFNFYTNPILSKNGDNKIISWQSTGMYDDADENKHMMLSIGEDITERKQVEEALKESERRQRILLDNIQIQIWYLTDETTYGTLNKAHADFNGVKIEDLAFRSLYDIFPKENADTCRQSNTEVFSTKKTVRAEEWMPHVSGEKRLISVIKTPKLRDDGTVEYVVCSAEDITERKQVEEALKESEQRLAGILYGTNSGTWEWNIQTGETSFNERWANIIGYTLHELEPISIQTWIDFIHPDDLKVSNELLEKLFKREIDYYECECRMKHNDGSWVWVLDRGKVISWTEDNKPLMVSGTHQDITRQKQTEMELMERKKQSQQLEKAESLNRMAGAIAHNFNNQLSVVIGNLELALDDLPDDTEIYEFLNEAINAAQRSSKISGSMLTYLGQSTIKLEVLNLSEVCRHILPLLHDTIQQENITLETDFMVPGPVVASNANQIQTVLTNLISNSVEAIGDGKGEITLKIKTLPASDIPKIHIAPIDWQPNAEIFACLEVNDTGCGISDEDIDKIFDPFFTTKFTGRGMGMSVILGIVKTWKGAVSAESRKGYGSIFRIFLPLSTDESPRQSEKEGITGSDPDNVLFL